MTLRKPTGPIAAFRVAAAIAVLAAAAAVHAQGTPTVDKLSSGVTVKHTVVGTGANPKASDTVKVHYRGTLDNGTEFDSSYKRNAPASFPLNRVVPCWTEGIQKLKVGGKATLTCPPETAYGARGIPGVIPPNSVLNFDVELLAIEK
ncbi:MAG: FKBP-type peptidyl-prolyl cis-trans isomerase [Burkholderiaceae bacterium]